MKYVSVPLGAVAKIERNGVSPESLPEETPYIGLEHIDRERGIQSSETVHTAALKSTKFRFTPSNVLYGKLRPYLSKIAIPTTSGVCSTDILPILPGDDLELEYLYHFLRQPSQVALATQRSSGANLPRLSPTRLAEFEIPLPPLPEQKRIALILNTADSLRAKRRESIAELDALLQSTFLEIFGDPIENPMDWKVVSCINLMKSPPKIGTIKPATGEGRLVVRVGEVGKSSINLQRCGRVLLTPAEYEKYKLIDGDIVLARAIGSKAQLGKASLFRGFNEEVVFDSHVMRLRFDNECCEPIWFYGLLSTSSGKLLLQRSGGATAVQFNINSKQASQIQVVLPPIKRQRQFVTIFKAIEVQKSRLQNHLSELDALFASLQSRAFNGEL